MSDVCAGNHCVRKGDSVNQVIRCTSCNEVCMKTPYDQWTEVETSRDGSLATVRETQRDDYRDFLSIHRAHRLEALRIVEDSYVSERPYTEPVKESYFKATNGREVFVIKKFRTEIQEPLRYQLVKGDFELRCKSVDIQSAAIQKQLQKEWTLTPISPTKVTTFLRLLRHIVETMDIRQLERVPEESALPLEVFYKMDDVSLGFLLRNSHNIFKGKEYSAMEAFIHRHREEGVLLLKATFEIRFSETLPTPQEVPGPLPLSHADTSAVPE